MDALTRLALPLLSLAVLTPPLGAQAPVLYGTVFGHEGRPLTGVAVALDGVPAALSDTAGEFRLDGIAPGTHVLTIAAAGHLPRTFRFSVPEGATGEIDLGAVLLTAERAHTAILGRVTDARTGEPIPAAVVTLDGVVDVATNVAGSFRITEVAPGTHIIHVRRIGYRRGVVAVELPADRSGVEVELRLDPVPVELPEVVVEGERTLYAYGRLRDFYQRRSRGVGHFIIRWDIERRLPRVATDVLRNVPGLQVTPGPVGRNTVRLADAPPGCGGPLLFLDGTLIRDAALDEILTPRDVEGIEIYTRASEVPLEFASQSGANCGVIAVWTR